MIEKEIKKELLKNIDLQNSINKASKCMFNKVIDGFSVDCSIGIRSTYAILELEVCEASDLRVYFDNMLIAVFNGNGYKKVPLLIDRVGKIHATGGCKSIQLIFTGATFLNVKKEYLIPRSSCMVLQSGDYMQIATYNNFSEIVDNNLIVLNAFKNAMCIQSIIVDGVYQIGVLISDNGVYYCNSLDNYANKVKICDYAKDAVILCYDGTIYVVYINNGLKYKTIVAGVLSEENQINIKNDRKPSGFGCIEILSHNICAFAIKWENGDNAVFVLGDGVFTQKLAIKWDYCKLVQVDDCLMIASIYDYYVKVSKFDLNNFEMIENKVFKNCDNVLFDNDGVLLSNMGNYTIKNEI